MASRGRKSMLTYPHLKPRDIAEILSREQHEPINEQDIKEPTAESATAIYLKLLELMKHFPREDVKEAIDRAIEHVEYPDLYREALYQVTLFREMHLFCESASLDLTELGTFGLEDLRPTRSRFVAILSGVINFARFREDINNRLDEERYKVSQRQEELESLHGIKTGLEESVLKRREELAREAPERERLLIESEERDAISKDLGSKINKLEEATKEVKSETNKIKERQDNYSYKARALEVEIEDLRSQMITSPDRINAELNDARHRHEKDLKELQSLRNMLQGLKERMGLELKRKEDLGFVLENLGKVENLAESIQTDQERVGKRRKEIMSHTYKIKELEQKRMEAENLVKSLRERNARSAEVHHEKLMEMKENVSSLVQERESRKLHVLEDEKKAIRLRSEANTLRASLEQERALHERKRNQLEAKFANVHAAFDAFAGNMIEAIQNLEGAVCMRLPVESSGS